MKRCIPFFYPLLFLSILWCGLFSTTLAQDNGTRNDPLTVVAESGEIYRFAGGKKYPVSQFGMRLKSGDEVITENGAKGYILLSMLSENNEVYMAPSSRIRIDRIFNHSGSEVLTVYLRYGKIRVRTIPMKGRQVRILTDTSEILAEEGEYIVQSHGSSTRVGTIYGQVKMVSRETNEGVYIPESMMSSSQTPAQPDSSKIMTKELFRGVEKDESERVFTVGEIRREMERKEAEERERRRQYEQREKEKRQQELALKKAEEEAEARKRRVEQQRQEVKEEPVKQEIIPSKVKIQIEAEPEKGPSFFEKYKWHIAATSTVIVFNWLALQEADAYDDLAGENDDLTAEYNQSNSSAEKASILAEFEVNKEKMSTHKTRMETYNYIALGALIWEGYLVYTLIRGNDEQKEHALSLANRFQIDVNPTATNPKLRCTFTWNF